VKTVADRYIHAAYNNKHWWQAFGIYQHRWLERPWTPQKGVFSEFFAIFGCSAHFNAELRRNGYIVINRFHDKLCTSELQFEFKNNSSTHMCTMVLKETLSYYTHHNSFVYCTFLDAIKAFDRVNFCKLFRILIDCGLPMYIVRMLINMYITQVGRISWTGILSNQFPILNGVRQGGVLSPLLLVRPKTIVFGRTYVLLQMFFSSLARSPRCVGWPAWNFARWSVLGWVL